MPRPRNDPGDHFGPTELALAAGLTVRNLEHLADGGLMPAGNDIKAVKRLAVIGAFAAVGAGPMMAARLAGRILEMEFNRADGEMPNGLSELARKLKRSETAEFPPDLEDYDYWYHRALHQDPERYPAGAMKSDAVIEILDRKFIFWRDHGQRFKAEFVGWISEWDRGADVTLVHASENNDAPPHWESTLKRATVVADDFRNRDRAVTAVSINVSLAIRRALDRIAKHRSDRLRKRVSEDADT